MISFHRRLHRENLKAEFGKDKRSVYNELVKRGYHLPSYNSPTVTRKYLKGVEEESFFSFYYEYHDFHYISVKKEIIYMMLKQAAGRTKLGFNILKAPSRVWMLAALYSLNRHHKVFFNGKRGIEAYAREDKELNEILLKRHKRKIREEYNTIIDNKIDQLCSKFPFFIRRRHYRENNN